MAYSQVKELPLQRQQKEHCRVCPSTATITGAILHLGRVRCQSLH
ncbi:hypothetical protein M758_9G064800 [Ceratodon purpureus]|nr:hypothetical protein M758_9G064800 [Ceratodon purpureus]